MSKKQSVEFAELLARVLWRLHTYGRLERAAGVTDRVAFWRGKTEPQAREQLRAMVADRLKRGEIELTTEGVRETPP